MTKKIGDKNILNRDQSVIVVKYLVKMEKELQEEQPTLIKLTDRLNKELPFKVTPINLETLLKIGIVEGYKPARSITKRYQYFDVDKIDNRLTKIEETLINFIDKITNLEIKIVSQESRIRTLEKSIMSFESELNGSSRI